MYIICTYVSRLKKYTILRDSKQFQSNGVSTGACNAQICRTNANICQIRLDFDSFEIAGPSTASVTVSKLLYGLASGTLEYLKI